MNTSVKTAAIVELYNSLADKQVKKFADRATAETRLAALVAEKGLTLVVSDEGAIDVVDPEEDAEVPYVFAEGTNSAGQPATETAKEKSLREKIETAEAARLAKKGKPARKGGARGPAPTYADTKKIGLLVTENPKRAGTASHARFSLYKDGMTVAEFVAAGGRRADLDWDVDHKFVDIS